MRRLSRKVWLILGLIILSFLLHFVHYLIFRDLHHIFLYLLGDIAFIPIEVLLAVLVLHQIITSHEKKTMFKKLNMVFGAFYSEVGTQLLKDFSGFDANGSRIKDLLLIDKNWRGKQFDDVRKKIEEHQVKIVIKKAELVRMRSFLISKRTFLLQLLENPNLLEHEGFTGLLWAVFHLGEELSYREDLNSLPEADYEHLGHDLRRVYVLLVEQWVLYMKHLQRDYPFLFSLALRTNPFDPKASVVIQ